MAGLVPKSRRHSMKIKFGKLQEPGHDVHHAHTTTFIKSDTALLLASAALLWRWLRYDYRGKQMIEGVCSCC
eukprot:3144279-Amphidinium_carterae.1